MNKVWLYVPEKIIYTSWDTQLLRNVESSTNFNPQARFPPAGIWRFALVASLTERNDMEFSLVFPFQFSLKNFQK